jgi:signal transduction histidine kinase
VQLRIERARPDELPGGIERGDEPIIAFRVIDTGIGIAEQHLSAIFDAFQQADGTTSRRYGGTAVRLGPVHQPGDAQLLGGQITAQSVLGGVRAAPSPLPLSE